MNNVIYRNASNQQRFGMILLHGRGAGAGDIMSLSYALDDNDFIYAAPQAPGNSWYPYSFLAPIEDNQPYLDNSLNYIGNVFKEFLSKGISKENIILTGFSQGACLALEYAFRNPGKYGGIAALSGGIISTTIQNDKADFDLTNLFLGCSEEDPHIPLERVNYTAEIFTNMCTNVRKTIYPGSFHGIVEDEISEVRQIVKKLKNK